MTVKQQSVPLSIRASASVLARIGRIKLSLDTRHTSEVVRRALEFYERCLSADSIEIIKDGQRHKARLQ